jgi:hypothetical protein
LTLKGIKQVSLPDHVSVTFQFFFFAIGLSFAVMAQLDDLPVDNERQAQLRSSVFRDIVTFSQADAKSAVVLNFKDLQLLRIKDLQQKLFDHQMRLRVGGIAPERYQDALKILDEDLAAYGLVHELHLNCNA